MARIKVTLKSTGQTGSIEERDFDPTMFTKTGEATEGKSGNKLKDYIYSQERAPIAESLQERGEERGGVGGFLTKMLGGAIKPGEAGLRHTAGSGVLLGQSVAGLLGSKKGQ